MEVDDFHRMSDKEISNYCVTRFKEDNSYWNDFKDFCISMGFVESLPNDMNPSDVEFKIIPFEGKKSHFALEANNILEEEDDEEDE